MTNAAVDLWTKGARCTSKCIYKSVTITVRRIRTGLACMGASSICTESGGCKRCWQTEHIAAGICCSRHAHWCTVSQIKPRTVLQLASSQGANSYHCERYCKVQTPLPQHPRPGPHADDTKSIIIKQIHSKRLTFTLLASQGMQYVQMIND
jgi:hypothetical protein